MALGHQNPNIWGSDGAVKAAKLLAAKYRCVESPEGEVKGSWKNRWDKWMDIWYYYYYYMFIYEIIVYIIYI